MDNASAVSSLDRFETFLTSDIRKELSQEVVVPDTMPDFAEVIEVSPLLLMRSKDVRSGRAEVEATLSVTAVCRADNGDGLFRLEASLPFSVTFEDDGITSDMIYLCRTEPACLEAKLQNPRKLLIRAEIWGRAELLSRASEPFSGYSGGDSGIYVKSCSTVITPIVSAGEKTFVLSDDYTLPPAKAPAKELLCSRVCVTVDEIRPIGKKLLFKGSAKTRFLYETVDSLCAPAEFLSSFSQIIETGSESGEPLSEISVMLTGVMFEITPGSSGRSINAELHLVAQCMTRAKTSFDYISDAYSNLYPVNVTTTSHSCECMSGRTALQTTVCEELETPVKAPDIIDAFASPGLPEINGAEICLPLTLAVVVSLPGGETGVCKKHTRAVFTFSLSEGETLRLLSIDCSDISALPTPDGVEIRLRAEADVSVMTESELTVVEKAELQTDEAGSYGEAPSIVIARGTKGEEWSLAKSCRSSVDAINRLNSDQNPTGRHMFVIPKTH